MYNPSGRDAFVIKDGYSNECVRNKEKMNAEHEPQLQAMRKRNPAMRRHLSCVSGPAHLPDQQERRREKLGKVLAELKIELISVSELIRDQLVSISCR